MRPSSLPIVLKNICIFLNVLLFAAIEVRGQVTEASISPVPETALSPTAFEFTKYGDYEVNALAGIPEINVPIYEFTCGSIKIPLKLNYNASGIKVNQPATWVGLGWSISGIGAVVRTVRGIPDNVQTYGWIDDETAAHTINSTQDFKTRQEYADLMKDPAPDFFKFVMPNHVGSFIYRKSVNKFEIIPYEQVDVQWINRHSVNQSIFVLTSSDGMQYHFEEQQQLSLGLEQPSNIPSALKSYTQSWFLTKIISANRQDTVSISYRTSPNYTSGHGGSHAVGQEWLVSKTVIKPYTSIYGPLIHDDIKSFYKSEFSVEPILDEIRFKTGRIKFIAGKARMDYPGPMLENIRVYAFGANDTEEIVQDFKLDYSYFSTPQARTQYDYRLKLLSLTRQPINESGSEEKHQFIYNEEVAMPSTSSSAIDYWGYYNGREQDFLPHVRHEHPLLQQMYSNEFIGVADRSVDEDMLQTGMLQTIIYPTAGKTNFVYESNKYQSDIPQTVQAEMMNARVTSTSKIEPSVKTFEFNWTSEYSRSQCFYDLYFSSHLDVGPFDEKEIQRVTVVDLTTQQILMDVYRALGQTPIPNKQPYRTDGFLYLTAGNKYRVTIVTRDEPGKVFVEFRMWGEKIRTVPSIKSGGGLRIKQIANLNNDNSLVSLKSYTYPPYGVLGRSDKEYNKCYYEESRYELPPGGFLCTTPFVRRLSVVYVGKAEVPQVNMNNSPVTYGFVTCVTSNGAEKILGKTEYTSHVPFFYNNSFYSPKVPGEREYISNNFGAGLPGSVKHYSYNEAASTYSLRESTIREYEMKNAGQEQVCNIWRNNLYPSHCITGGHVATLNDFGSVLYSLNLGAYKLIREKKTYFEEAGDAHQLQTKLYQYNNPIHLLPSKIITINSQGREDILTLEYPQDASVNNASATLLRDFHIYNQILRKKHFADGRFVEGEQLSFKNSGGVVPSLYLWENGQDTLTRKISFSTYNTKGKLVETIEQGSPPRVVLWSYKNTLPIAEIQNLSFLEVSQIMSEANKDLSGFSELINPTEAEIDNFLEPLRRAKAWMKTMIYRPLIGMSRLTQESGISRYYKYDGFGRLINLLNDNDQVKEAYKYNYSK